MSKKEQNRRIQIIHKGYIVSQAPSDSKGTTWSLLITEQAAGRNYVIVRIPKPLTEKELTEKADRIIKAIS